MADGDSHAAQSNKTVEGKKPELKRVYMIHLGTERMELKKFFKK
jgi:hypothetical protein